VQKVSPYYLPFSHSTSVTDERQTDRRQITDDNRARDAYSIAVARKNRALCCILGDVSYCPTLGLITLNDRCEQLTKHFFSISLQNQAAVLYIFCH